MGYTAMGCTAMGYTAMGYTAMGYTAMRRPSTIALVALWPNSGEFIEI